VKTTFLIVLLFVTGGIIAYQFYAIAYRPPSLSRLEHVRAMVDEAAVLRDSAQRVRQEAGVDQIDLANELEGQASQLLTEVEILSGKRKLTSLVEASERFRRESQALSDSAVRIRERVLAAQGSITPAQQRALDRINRYAASAKRMAGYILKTRLWPVNDRLEAYDVGLFALIEGRRAAFDLKYLLPNAPTQPATDRQP